MKNVPLALLGALALSGCASSDDGDEPITPPAIEDVFVDQDADGMIGGLVQVGEMDGQPIFETRYLFDDTRLRELCVWPDADSFDDYEERDADGNVIVPRGVTPVSDDCPADGIVTGPLHEELYPSSWCRIAGCVAGGGNPGNEQGEGGY